MFQANEDSIVKSLEIIAKCMVKSNEMAKEALRKSNELHEANMAMMRESQINYDGEIKIQLLETGICKLDGMDNVTAK